MRRPVPEARKSKWLSFGRQALNYFFRASFQIIVMSDMERQIHKALVWQTSTRCDDHLPNANSSPCSSKSN